MRRVFQESRRSSPCSAATASPTIMKCRPLQPSSILKLPLGMWMTSPLITAAGPVRLRNSRIASTVSSCSGLPSCAQEGSAKQKNATGKDQQPGHRPAEGCSDSEPEEARKQRDVQILNARAVAHEPGEHREHECELRQRPGPRRSRGNGTAGAHDQPYTDGEDQPAMRIGDVDEVRPLLNAGQPCSARTRRQRPPPGRGSSTVAGKRKLACADLTETRRATR